MNALSYKKNSSGIGVLLRELSAAYSRAIKRPCVTVIPKDSPDFPMGKNAKLIRMPWAYTDNFRRLLFQTFAFGRNYCHDAALLISDSKCPILLPESCILLPLITDLAVYRMPEVYQLSRAVLWQLQYRYVRRRADRFLAISEFTKNEMVKLWNIPADKIDVVPCACSDNFRREENAQRLQAMREKYRLPEQFVLFVGNFNPRKNLKRLIKAFDLAKSEKQFPHQLIIAGEQGWKFDRQEAVDGCRFAADVRFIGFVPDEDMAALYSAASLFVFPSLYEGFGIPVLEAQLCGAPVLTSNLSSLPEVGGDGAYYVDPYSEEEIAAGIARLLTEPKLAQRLTQLGRENAARFSWEKSAACLEAAIEKELRRRSSDRRRETKRKTDSV